MTQFAGARDARPLGDILRALLKRKRMGFGMPHKIKGTKDLKAILDKAAEIEKSRQGI